MAEKGPNWVFLSLKDSYVINIRFPGWTAIVKVGPNTWFHDPVDDPG